jgi:hypothetical protein
MQRQIFFALYAMFFIDIFRHHAPFSPPAITAFSPPCRADAASLIRRLLPR